MPAKVFISCGQRERGEEQRVAKQLEEWFTSQMYDPYVAYRVQTLNDVMAIIEALERSDYFLFIDFCRESLLSLSGGKLESLGFRGSLFSHQELALAHYLGFGDDVIVLRHRDLQPEGFLRYTQANPVSFDSPDEVVGKVEALVQHNDWSPESSRHFGARMGAKPLTPIRYYDHTTGREGRVSHVWGVHIENRQRKRVALNVIASLRELAEVGGQSGSPDKSPLKWAGQQAYAITILPRDEWAIDVLSIDAERSHRVFLHSLADALYLDEETNRLSRPPVIGQPGRYHLTYRVDSVGFPALLFVVELELSGNINTTEARIGSTRPA